jgi:transcriptional pleiotropic regulator of transition state genes
MRSLGITRKLDELGRVTLPKSLRKTMGAEAGTPLEVFVQNDNEVVLRVYKPGCVFCENVSNLTSFNGCQVCRSCMERIAEIIK